MGIGDCSAPTPACRGDGVCVECTKSEDCKSDIARPICDTNANACVRCANDQQCVDKLGADPGVCMSHQDGHCATNDEAVYVQQATNQSTCPSATTPSAGSPTLPFCQINQALAAAATKRLLVIRGDMIRSDSISNTSPLSVIGQGATIRPGGASPGLHVTGTDVYIRGLKILGSMGTDVGIVADGSATIRLDSIVVDGMSKGGILIDGSAFDIEKTSVTSNGPGTFMGLTNWGGILINNPPTGGPTRLDLVTVRMNNEAGISCSTAVQGTGVLAIDNMNTSVQVGATCGFSSCGTASAICGAP